MFTLRARLLIRLSDNKSASRLLDWRGASPFESETSVCTLVPANPEYYAGGTKPNPAARERERECLRADFSQRRAACERASCELASNGGRSSRRNPDASPPIRAGPARARPLSPLCVPWPTRVENSRMKRTFPRSRFWTLHSLRNRRLDTAIYASNARGSSHTTFAAGRENGSPRTPLRCPLYKPTAARNSFADKFRAGEASITMFYFAHWCFCRRHSIQFEDAVSRYISRGVMSYP